MTTLKLSLALVLGILLGFAVSAVRPHNVYAACGDIHFPPCPPSPPSTGGDTRHKKPTPTPVITLKATSTAKPTITPTATSTATPTGAPTATTTLPVCSTSDAAESDICVTPTPLLVQLPPRQPNAPIGPSGLGGLLPLLCVGGGAIGGLLLIGLVALNSGKNRGVNNNGDVASIKPRKDPTPETGVQPNITLNTSGLKNISQIPISGYAPQNGGGAQGTLAGLNQALNRMGIPGIGGGGFGNDDDPEGPMTKSYDITPTGKDGDTYQNGGFTIEHANGWTDFYAYDDGDRAVSKSHLVAITDPEAWKDPVPDDDATSGPGSLPVDGTGNIRPHGDVLDLENSGMPGIPGDLHGDLTNLAHLNENSNLGSSSGPGTQQGGATDPSSDSDTPVKGDVGDLKDVIIGNNTTFDPSPEHPVSKIGKSTGTTAH